MEINRQDLSQKLNSLSLLTKLIFIIIVGSPILIKLTVLVSTRFYSNAFYSEISFFILLDAILPYILAFWLYLSQAKFYFLKKNLKLLEQNQNRYEIIRSTLRDINASSISVLSYPDETIGAQAFGTRKHRYIAISQKALDVLSDDELKALMLHEAAHHVYGDVWRYNFVRYLVILTFSVEFLVYVVSGFILHIVQTGRPIDSAILRVLPQMIILIPYAILPLGIVFLVRIREAIADIFAIQTMNNVSALQSLFVKITVYFAKNISKQKRKFGNFFFVPEWLIPYPKNRIEIHQRPNLIFEQLYALLVFIGLLSGAFFFSNGRIESLILFSIPFLCISGPPIIYYFVTRFQIKKDYSKYVFAYSSIVALTSLFMNASWQIIESNSTNDFYYISSPQRFLDEFLIRFDNYLVTAGFGSIYTLLILFLFLMINRFFEHFLPKAKIIKLLLLISLWFFLSFTIFMIWAVMFGPYPYLVTAWDLW